MPRRTARRCTRRVEETKTLDPNLREILRSGRGFYTGEQPYQTRQEWAEAWHFYGDQVLGPFVEKHPGRRPAAMYAAGLIPARPILKALPTGHGFVVVRVLLDDGQTVDHLFGSFLPWIGCEADHLLAYGIIDKAEHAAHGKHWTHDVCSGVAPL